MPVARGVRTNPPLPPEGEGPLMARFHLHLRYNFKLTRVGIVVLASNKVTKKLGVLSLY